MYSNQFLITARDNKSENDLVITVSDEIKKWIFEKLITLVGDFDEQPRFNVPWKNGETSIFMTQSVGTKASIYTYDLTHPEERDSTRLWRVFIRLSNFSGVVEFHIELYAGYSIRTLKPTPADPRPPRIVKDLIGKFDCYAFDKKLMTSCIIVTNNNLDDFVLNELLDSSRKIPTIIITPSNEICRPFTDPDSMARDLAGLATVAFIENITATRMLSDRLGRRLGCFNGGVRIYWPGFSLIDDPFFHKLYVGSGISVNPRGFDIHFRRLIYDVACNNTPDGEIFKRARLEVSRETASKIQDTKDIKKLQQLITEKEALLEAKDYEILDLKEQVSQIQKAWGETLRDSQRSALEDVDDSIRLEAKKIITAGDVLEHAESCMGCLIIHERARQCSKGYRTIQIDELLNVLEALDDLGLEYYENERKLGVGLREWFKIEEERIGKRIPEFKIKDHQTTLTKFGEERTIVYRDKKVILEKHFTIGGGDSEGCLQVYWEFDDESKCILVGYVGPHLHYAREDG
jgi:hypothetical protein